MKKRSHPTVYSCELFGRAHLHFMLISLATESSALVVHGLVCAGMPGPAGMPPLLECPPPNWPPCFQP